jgi:putative transposase
MARRPRLCVPELPHLVLQRAAAPAFGGAADYRAYLGRLAEAAPRHGVAVHAYALLPCAVWLLLTPRSSAGLSALLQTLARSTSRSRLALLREAGADPVAALWDGRFRSAPLQPGAWTLAALCGVDLAPQLEGEVGAAADWPWTSLAHHAGAAPQPWLRDASAYWELGNTPYAREAEFRRLAESGLAAQRWPVLRAAVLSGLALGDARFIAGLENQLERPLRAGRRGRPSVPI